MGLFKTWAITSLVATAVVIVGIIGRYVLSTRRPKNFPPGPPTFLGLGNILQIPVKQPYLKFQEWSRTYGSIIGIKVGPANLVVLHDPQHVHELLSKRGAIYSGRRMGYIISEVVLKEHRDRHVLNVQPGPYLRRWRTATTSLFGATGQKQTFPMQEATSSALVQRLSEATADESLDHLKYWALATPLLAITGQRLEGRGKAWADQYFRTQDLLLHLIEPGTAPPVDIFPILRWVPEVFAKWKTAARHARAASLEDHISFLTTAKSLRGAGGPTGPGTFRCGMTKVLEEDEQENTNGIRFTDDDVAMFGKTLLAGAVDTTWASIMSFVLFMAAYPDIQSKAYAEIQRMSGYKPPRVETVDQLPYLKACFLEILRVRPPLPSGVPRILDQDDNFGGYYIPKGTTVMINIWSMQHNPNDYDDPDDFRPERYLRHAMGTKPGVEKFEGRRISHAFGEGRRICPGDQFAQRSIILAISKILWAFEIVALEPLDLSVETGYHTGITLSPKPFKVDFRMRNEANKASISQDYEDSLLALREIGL